MAKGDFIHAPPDTTSYTAADFRLGKTEPGAAVAGVTLLFLFVTVKLEKRMIKPEPLPGEEGPEAEPRCVCMASITDYALQGNVYVDKDVAPGFPQMGVVLHELYHLLHHRNEWTGHKAELDTLLDGKSYSCSEDSRTQVVQDIFAWFIRTFYSYPHEELLTQLASRLLQKVINKAPNPDKVLDGVFGPNRMQENAADARPDRDLPIKGRFESRVIVTWDGSCS